MRQSLLVLVRALGLVLFGVLPSPLSPDLQVSLEWRDRGARIVTAEVLMCRGHVATSLASAAGRSFIDCAHKI